MLQAIFDSRMLKLQEQNKSREEYQDLLDNIDEEG